MRWFVARALSTVLHSGRKNNGKLAGFAKTSNLSPPRHGRLGLFVQDSGIAPSFPLSRGFSTADTQGPLANTTNGKLRGKVQYAKNNKMPVYTFLGIPFAAPPVGELRFKAPEPPASWTGVRDATEFGLPCPQNLKACAVGFHPTPCPHEETSEDCLFLNVYTPSLDGRRPVMFWIHGGGFFIGMGSLTDGTAYAATQDVVIVTINYRLGPFGFLSTGDEHAPGNCGILDQQAALRWVRDNIANFGGDPQRVTLFGQSAGSISVSCQILSPLSKGLFQRGISQSGTPLLPNAVTKDPMRNVVTLAKELGCESDSSSELISYLRQQPADAIMAALTKPACAGLVWSIVVDGRVFPDQPKQLYARGDYHKVDYMAGANTHEGYLFASFLFPDFTKEVFTFKMCVEKLRAFMTLLYKGNKLDEIMDAIHKHFIGDDPQKIQNKEYLREKFAEAAGEALETAPTYKAALLHQVGGARTYFYEYGHRPSYSKKPAWVTGADHAEDILFTWGDALMDTSPASKVVTFTEEEARFSTMFMTYLANFAKTGDPNGEGLVRWPEFTDEEYFLKITGTPTVGKVFKSTNMTFWNETIPQIQEGH